MAEVHVVPVNMEAKGMEVDVHDFQTVPTKNNKILQSNQPLREFWLLS